MTSIISGMTAVFDAIFTWIATALGSVTELFYVAETGFTFLGVLSLIALGMSIFFLLVGVISNFLHLRG